MFLLFVIGIGGFIGASTRFGLMRLMEHYPSFPFSTLFSNVIAAFVVGLIIGTERQIVGIPINVKYFLTVGLLGGLSTFSTFSLETVIMLESNEYIKASFNILLNVSLSIIAVFAGLLIVKTVKMQ